MLPSGWCRAGREAPESRHCSRPSFPGPSGAFQTDVTPVCRSDLATIRELFRQGLRRVSAGAVIWASPSAGLARVTGFIFGEIDTVLRSENMGTRP